MRGVNVSEHETLQRKQRYAEESDAELARRVAAGETAAFEFIMRRHNRALFHTARAILHNDAEAEDALQDAYLQAYRAIGTYRAEARLSTWLARIVANEAFMRLRKHARRCTILPLQPGVALEDIASSMGEDMDSQPELCAGRAEMRRLLESRIDALPDAYRVVFMLRARLACEIDIACADAFAFGGERCDRIVARVLQEISCQKETPCP
jgi:RNA polymerase sigma-70 factor (ECF subfamily)